MSTLMMIYFHISSLLKMLRLCFTVVLRFTTSHFQMRENIHLYNHTLKDNRLPRPIYMTETLDNNNQKKSLYHDFILRSHNENVFISMSNFINPDFTIQRFLY